MLLRMLESEGCVCVFFFLRVVNIDANYVGESKKMCFLMDCSCMMSVICIFLQKMHENRNVTLMER